MSIWYKTGTIAVSNGSTAVVGSGTTWVGVVRLGDALIAPDGRNYEIAAINSNTSITLANAYQGSTASAQAYSIQPTRAVAQEWLAAVQAFQSQVNGWQDGALSGLFGNGNAGSPGIAFSAQTNTGLYRPAASILALSVNGTERARFTASGMQLTGLLTGTAVTQSATDTTAGRVIRAQDGYVRGSILGTVSQSAGVPTGAIIQRGSNANGEFVRFADGTQICTLLESVSTIDVTLAQGSLFRGFGAAWTYPAVFSTTTNLIAIAEVSTTGGGFASIIGTRPGGTSTTQSTFNIYATESATFTNVPLRRLAIGRWF